ncbi:MAG: MFS transporter [Gammaproteobacteria bacterium]|nr:MFS transporter [Gammaproteobacteria bacterium]
MNSQNLTLEQGADFIKQESKYAPWVVCFIASLFFFYEFIQMNMFNAMNAQLMQEFSLTAAMLGKLSASYFYANVLFLVPAGLILDRFSTKKIIIIALTVCVAGTFSFSLARNIELVTLCRFLTGIGSAFCFLSCIRLASRWFPRQRMALISGLIVTMAMVGGMIAQAPLTLLVNSTGWRAALQFDAMLGMGIIVLIFIFVRDFPAHMRSEFDTDRQELKQYGNWQSMKHAFLSRQNWFCGIYTSLLNLPLFLLGGLWGSLYLNSVHHLTRTDSTIVTSMIFLGTIVGSPMMGWLSDKLETRKKPMIVGAIASSIVVALIMFSSNLTLPILLLLFFLLGWTTSTQVISYPVVTESNQRMLTATCVSVVSLCAISGGAIFEPLFGWLMDYHWTGTMAMGLRQYSAHDFQFAMWLFPIGIVVAFFAALSIKETFGSTPK